MIFAIPISVFFAGLIGGCSTFLRNHIESQGYWLRWGRRAIGDLLLIGIGLKGGLGVAQSVLSGEGLPGYVLILGIAGVLYGAFLPRWSTAPLAHWLGWSGAEAATLAGYYGSVSIMTFGSACLFLDQSNALYHPGMTIILLAMEFPPLLAALRIIPQVSTEMKPFSWWGLVRRHRMFWMLMISMMSSYIVAILDSSLLQVVLMGMPAIMMLFLFDQGFSIAAAYVKKNATPTLRLMIFAIVFPTVQGIAALCFAWIIGARLGDGVLFGVLLASASYLAAPAFFSRLRPSPIIPLCTAASLGITFPWNLAVVIPSLVKLAEILWGNGKNLAQ